MTLGEKLRKFRLLHNKTQKQLGEEIGFKKSTADVRINQYETNKIAPKNDIRLKLAEILDLDMSALSDINVSSYEDIMHILFLLEEKYKMEIEKKDGKTYLVFDDSNREILTLITYMNMWCNQKAALMPDPHNITADQKKNYHIWQSHFKKATDEYFACKEEELAQHYKPLIEQFSKQYVPATKTSEISRLIVQMQKAGLSVATDSLQIPMEANVPGFSFVVNELLNPPTSEAEKLLIQFYSELEHFSQLGVEYFTEFQMPEQALIVTYYIPVNSFWVIKMQVDNYLNYINSSEKLNDFFRHRFEVTFENDLKLNYNMIEEEIQRYVVRKNKTKV